MSLIVENKRRVVAATATLIVLLAIGFAIGRLSSGPAQASAAESAAAAAGTTSARVTPVPVTAVTTLRAGLLQAQRVSADATRQLAAARAANRQLSAAHQAAQGRLADVRRCQSIGRPRVFRRCVKRAVG
jgi:hypothetical protein